MAFTNYKTILRADYKAYLGYFDSLIPIALSLLESYPDWQTDRLSITMNNFAEWSTFFLGHNSYVYTRDMKREQARGQDEMRIREILEKAPPKLARAEYSRLGLRCSICVPLK